MSGAGGTSPRARVGAALALLTLSLSGCAIGVEELAGGADLDPQRAALRAPEPETALDLDPPIPEARFAVAPSPGAGTLFGFSTQPYGRSLAAISETEAFIAAEGEIAALTLPPGAPWEDASASRLIPAQLWRSLRARDPRREAGQPLVVTLSALSVDGDALAPGPNGAPPPGGFGDPNTALAYARYVLWVIDALAPTYVVFDDKVDRLFAARPELWPQYLAFSESVSSAVRARYPSLPIAQSLNLPAVYAAERAGAPLAGAARSVAAASDFTALVHAPHALGQGPDADFAEPLRFAAEWAPTQLAFVEAGAPAERAPLGAGVFAEYDAEAQARFFAALHDEAERAGAVFAIWRLHRDSDAVLEAPSGDGALAPDGAASALVIGAPEEARLWRDTGLLDAEGRPRSAFALWRQATR